MIKHEYFLDRSYKKIGQTSPNCLNWLDDVRNVNYIDIYRRLNALGRRAIRAKASLDLHCLGNRNFSFSLIQRHFLNFVHTKGAYRCPFLQRAFLLRKGRNCFLARNVNVYDGRCVFTHRMCALVCFSSSNLDTCSIFKRSFPPGFQA